MDNSHRHAEGIEGVPALACLPQPFYDGETPVLGQVALKKAVRSARRASGSFCLLPSSNKHRLAICRERLAEILSSIPARVDTDKMDIAFIASVPPDGSQRFNAYVPAPCKFATRGKLMWLS